MSCNSTQGHPALGGWPRSGARAKYRVCTGDRAKPREGQRDKEIRACVGNPGYDLTIRGFKTGGTDKNAIMVDGLPGLTGRFGSPPTIGVDHIELVKGPMSVLYGQIQPGGFVNLISKRPRATESAELDV